MENKNELIKTTQKRIIYLDVLKLLATFAVIILHVAAIHWNTESPDSFNWNVFNFYDSIVRWAVPIFVMISGALFLDNSKELDIKKLYKKNILRIITAFIFWSAFYAAIICIFGDSSKLNIKSFLGRFIVGHYHLWFLYMIVGLYIMTPVLRKITKDIKTTEYFLIISIIFSFVIPTLSKVPSISNINEVLGHINLNFGYTTYFILGYYLSIKDFSPRIKKIIYLLSILGFLVTIFGSAIISNYIMKPYGLYNGLDLNVFFEAIGVFVFVKNIKFNISNKQNNILNKLVKYSFGVYLIHAGIIEFIKKIGFTTLIFNPIISVPIISILIFIISLIISAIINHMPILKKYIV